MSETERESGTTQHVEVTATPAKPVRAEREVTYNQLKEEVIGSVLMKAEAAIAQKISAAIDKYMPAKWTEMMKKQFGGSKPKKAAAKKGGAKKKSAAKKRTAKKGGAKKSAAKRGSMKKKSAGARTAKKRGGAKKRR